MALQTWEEREREGSADERAARFAAACEEIAAAEEFIPALPAGRVPCRRCGDIVFEEYLHPVIAFMDCCSLNCALSICPHMMLPEEARSMRVPQ